MITSEQFLQLIERHLADNKIPPSRFGKDVLGDPCFVFDLRSGRKPNLNSVNRVLDHIKGSDPAAREGAAA